MELTQSDIAGLDLGLLRTLKSADKPTALKFGDESEEQQWREKRLGMLTGSEFGKLVVRSKDRKGYVLSTGEVATRLIYRTAWERLLKAGNISNGLGRLNVNSASLEHGEEYEGEAILLYMDRTGREVDYRQKFIEYDSFIGGTPDGYVGEEGLIEVKCPWDGGNHIRGILTGEVYNPEYIYQMQGYMWMTGRKWCDFVTYDPDLCEALQLNVIRVERNETIICGIRSVLEEAKSKIEEIMNNERFKL